MAQNPFYGVGDFVAALRNGGEAREGAFRKELDAVAGLDRKLAEAAMVRRQNEAQAAQTAQDLIDLGVAEHMAPAALRGWQAGGGNFNTFTGGLGNLMEQSLRQQAVDAAQASGKFTDYNVPLVGLVNKPIETADIKSGNIVMENYGGAPAIFPTEGEQARIGAAMALAAQRSAAAGASDARANLYGRTDPNRPRGGKDKKPSGNAVPSMPTPKSKADFDALPSGTRFTAPDGSVRVKP